MKTFLKFLSSKTLFIRWFLTYLMMIVIAVGFVAQVYAVYSRIIQRDLYELNSAYLQYSKSYIDEGLRTLDSMVYKIEQDNNVNISLNYSKGFEEVYNPGNMRNAVSDLILHNSVTPFAKQIIIYANKSGITLTSETLFQPELMYVLAQNQFGLSGEALEAVFQERYDRQIIGLDELTGNSDHSDRIFYVKSTPTKAIKQIGNILVEINQQTINELVREDTSESNSTFMIMDSKSKVIYKSEPSASDLKLDYDQLADGKHLNLRLDGMDYIVFSVDSEVHDLKYVRAVGAANYYSEMNDLRRNTVYMILIFAFVNIGLAFFMTRRLHQPIKNVVKKVSVGEERTDRDELKYIEEAIDAYNASQNRMSKDLLNQEKILKEMTLMKLLKGRFVSMGEISGQLKNVHLDCDDSRNLVFVIKVNRPVNEASIVEEATEADLAQFIIRNVFVELFQKLGNPQIIKADAMVACILFFEGGQKDQVYDLLTEGLQLLNDRFNMTLSIGVSNEHETLIGVSEAYNEALESMIHVDGHKDTAVMFYGDIDKPKRHYDYSIETEYKLMNLIEFGKLAESQLLLKEILHSQSGGDLLSAEAQRCLSFDLMGTIMKASVTDAVTEYIASVQPVKRLSNASTQAQREKIFSELIDRICHIVNDERTLKDSDPLSERVKRYIEEHYADEQLNVSEVGEAFGLAPSYLSKLFKEATGGTLLNYIVKVRMNHAIELINDSDKSINRISGEVGYTHGSVFIRNFKKIYGITPGQHREQNRSKRHDQQ